MSTKNTAEKTTEAPPVGAQVIEGLTAFRDALRDEASGGEGPTQRFTVRTVALDLEPRPYAAGDVRRVRRGLHASQAVLARLLGVSASTVRAWERGERTPSAIARRFLDEIEADPPRWRRRLQEASVKT